MVLVETSFPRGGTVKQEKKQEEITFGARQENRKKDKHKKKDKTARTSETVREIKAVSAELLSHKTIQEGMIIMGVVKSVDPTALKISLPGRIVGRVLASAISDSYHKIMQKYVDGASEGTEMFKPLPEFFHVGQIVCTKVLDILKTESGHLRISLSLKPADVHSSFSHQQLRRGQMLFGAVEEVQEHGYIMESGIKGLRCFLPYEESEEGYCVGQLICTRIEKLTQTAAASIALCKSLAAHSRKIKDLAEPNLDYILPSTVVNFTISKILKDGLQGTIMNGTFTAYVNEHQLRDPLGVPRDYEVNTTVAARILYVMPLTKLMYLSLRLQAEVNDNVELKRGDIVKEATVHHIGTGGIVLDLEGKGKGLISFKSIKTNYTGNYDQEEVLTKYKKHSKHNVRILDYDIIDNLFTCSDNPAVVSQKYYTLSDLNPGDFVTGTVDQKDSHGGFFIRVGNVHGFIEKIFLAATSGHLQDNAKIRCRVLWTNSDRNIVYLTNLNEYMSKTASILTQVSAAKPNRVFVGTIVKVDEKCFIIRFFGDVKGILYKTQISDEITPFYEGATMNFRIVSREGERIVLGLAEEMHKIGEICEATVTNIIEPGLAICIAGEDNKQINGLVPVRLLSDFQGLVVGHLKTYSIDDKISVACILRNLYSVRDIGDFEKNPVKQWKDIKAGDIIKGRVKNVEAELIEVILPIQSYNKVIKVHANMFLECALSEANIVLVADQVVYVKVLSKEGITKTLTVSAKLTDVWDCDLKSSGELFARYLNEVEKIRNEFMARGMSIGSYTIGDKVKGKVTSHSKMDGNWIIELPDNINGVIKPAIADKTLKIGKEVECSILWVDYSLEVIYLTHKPADCSHISSGLTLSEKYKGQTGLNAKILLKTDDFTLCSLKKGQNSLICIPNRLHFNDFENIAVTTVKEGEFCRLAFIHEKYPIAVLESTWKFWKRMGSVKRKAETKVKEELRHKKVKILKPGDDTETGKEVALKKNYVPLLRNFSDDTELDSNDGENLFFTDKGKSGRSVEKKKRRETECGSSDKAELVRKLPYVEAKHFMSAEAARKQPYLEPIHFLGPEHSDRKLNAELRSPHRGANLPGASDLLNAEVSGKRPYVEAKYFISPEYSGRKFNSESRPPQKGAILAGAGEISSSDLNAEASRKRPYLEPIHFISSEDKDRLLQKGAILPGASDFWSTDLNALNNSAKLAETSSEDESDGETSTNPKKKKKKQTAAEKFRAAREEEARLRQIEENYANPNKQPETADEFDRLVLANPNNSITWINYIVFHLQAAEIDKARSIARRALKTISFREELELINIWVTLLNLELRYGTTTTFNEVLKESTLCNDPYKIYTKCLEILSDTQRVQELNDLIPTVTKKFKDKPDIWKNAANAYFAVGLADKAKQLLHKALNALPERDHINVIVMFANLHHKNNDKETAHTLLDQIVTSYPKRIDVWSQYVDMLIKDNDIESARRILERAVAQKIPIKKMRSLFKKYLEFEEKFGNDETVQSVKQLAANYVKNEISA